MKTQKDKPAAQQPAHPPIVVNIPPQVEQRMAAICDLASAIKTLADALNTHVAQVVVSHNHFDVKTGPAISYGGDSGRVTVG